MCDPHKMVINNVSKVVCRIAVRLDKDHVIKLFIINGHISVKLVMEGGCSLCGIVLPDNKRLSLSKVLLNLFL